MQPVDLTPALKATEGDVELLSDVVAAFLEEYPQLLAQIEPAIAARDGESVQRASHTIAGTLRIFGNPPVRQLARELEEIGRNHRWPAAEASYLSLKSSLEEFGPRVVQAINSLKNQA